MCDRLGPSKNLGTATFPGRWAVLQVRRRLQLEMQKAFSKSPRLACSRRPGWQLNPDEARRPGLGWPCLLLSDTS